MQECQKTNALTGGSTPLNAGQAMQESKSEWVGHFAGITPYKQSNRPK